MKGVCTGPRQHFTALTDQFGTDRMGATVKIGQRAAKRWGNRNRLAIQQKTYKKALFASQGLVGFCRYSDIAVIGAESFLIFRRDDSQAEYRGFSFY